MADDLFIDDVTILLHMEGSNGQVELTNAVGQDWLARSGAALSDTQALAGTASVSMPGGTAANLLSPVYMAYLHNGSTAYTIELSVWWPTAVVGTLLDSSAGATASVGVFTRLNADGSLQFRISSGVSGTYAFEMEAPAGTVVAGAYWTHIAFVYDPAGASYIFVDGLQVGTAATQNSLSAAVSSYQPMFGLQHNNQGKSFPGFVDEFRITLAKRYDAAFTPGPFPYADPPAVPPGDPYLDDVAYLFTGGGLITLDPVNLGNAAGGGIAHGSMAYSTADPGLGGVSTIRGDSLHFVGQAALGAAFTYEVRVRWDANSILYIFDNRAGTDLPIAFYMDTANLILHVDGANRTSNTKRGTNTWVDIALTYDGTTFRVFMDGLQVGSYARPGEVFTDNPLNLFGYTDGGSSLSGYFENMRLTLDVARYDAGGYTPASAPFPDFASVSGWSTTGDVTVTQDGTDYLARFESDGTLTLDAPTVVDIAVVGGGGCGNSFGGGGGGGGGIAAIESRELAAGTYDITFGEGGSGELLEDGGLSGFYLSATPIAEADGGEKGQTASGGARGGYSGAARVDGVEVLPSYPGKDFNPGGGSGAAGEATSRFGQDGLAASWFGTYLFGAGGGGGDQYDTVVEGGLDGGGAGGPNPIGDTQDGAPFSGGGAGGLWNGGATTRGDGGSGVVYVRLPSGSGGELWTPADITTELWLDVDDAATITEVGGSVSQWSDKSGNDYHATQGTTGNQPTYNAVDKTIFFDGSTEHMDFPTGLLNGEQNVVFAAVISGSVQSNAGLFGPGASAALGFEVLHSDGSGNPTTVRIQNDRKLGSGGWPTNSADFGIVAVDYNASLSSAWANGSPLSMVSTTGGSTLTSTTYNLGSYAGAGFEGDFTVKEWVFVTGTIEAGTKDKLEGYLAWKWGLEGDLPTDHRYKDAPPYNAPVVGEPWTPADIKTEGWFDGADAATITEVGGAVSEWADKSGEARHAGQATVSRYPTYDPSNNWVDFDGTEQRLVLASQPWTGAAPRLVIAVVQQDTVHNLGKAFYSASDSGGVAGRLWDICPETTGLLIRVFGNDEYQPSITVNEQELVAADWKGVGDSSTSAVHVNGASSPRVGGSSAALSTSVGQAYLGASLQQTNVHFDGKICEIVILTDDAVTDKNRILLEGYLAWKWGQQSKLPVDHLYKDGAPRTFENTWSPADTSTELWFDGADADTVVPAGAGSTDVQIWEDKSGNGRDAGQATASSMPTYDAAGQRMYFPTAGNGEYFYGLAPIPASVHNNPSVRVFVLQAAAVPGSNTAYSVVLQLATADLDDVFWHYEKDSSNSTELFYNGSSDIGSDAQDDWDGDTDPHILTVVVDGANSGILFDGAPLNNSGGTIVPDTLTADQNFRIGRGTFSNGWTFVGYQSEIIVSHEVADQQKFEGYLAWKWGLQGNLPADHLYKSAPPLGIPQPGDPLWDDVVSLLHFEGEDNDTTTTDVIVGTEWVISGDGVIKNKVPPIFGSTCYQVTSTGRLKSTSLLPIGTGDFTIECFVLADLDDLSRYVFDFRSVWNSSTEACLRFQPGNGGTLRYYTGGADRITGTEVVLGASNPVHVALCRKDSITRLFVNGTQDGSDYADTNNYSFSVGFVWGNYSIDGTTNVGLDGYLDECRITIGAGRYTADFTVPTEAFPNYGITGLEYSRWEVAQDAVISTNVTTDDQITASNSNTGWGRGQLSAAQADTIGCEFTIDLVGGTPGNGRCFVGFQDGTAVIPALADRILWRSSGQTQVKGSTATVLSTYDTGDVLGFVWKNGNLWCSKNGVWEGGGNPDTDTSPTFTGLTLTDALYNEFMSDNVSDNPQVTLNSGGGAYTYLSSQYTFSQGEVPPVEDLPPTITAQPVDTTGDEFSGVNLGITAEGEDGNAVSYEWFLTPGDTSVGTSATLALTNLQAAQDQTQYYCVVTDDVNGLTTQSDTVTLTVTLAETIVITTQPQPAFLLDGGVGVFTVAATGVPTITYQWYENAVELVGETADTFTKTFAAGEAGNVYTVLLTDGNGQFLLSDEALVTIVQPPVIVTQPISGQAIEFREWTMTVAAVGNSPFTYQWYEDAVPILLAEESVLAMYGDMAFDGSAYYVVVTDTYGYTVQSDSATMDIEPSICPDIGEFIDSDILGPADTSIPFGQGASFTVSVASDNSTPPHTYQWYSVEDGIIDGLVNLTAVTEQLTITPLVTDQGKHYYVVIHDADGLCGQSRAALLTLRAPELYLAWSVADTTDVPNIFNSMILSWSVAEGREDGWVCPVRTHRGLTDDGETYWIPFYDKSARCSRGPLINDAYNRYYWTQDGQNAKYAPLANLMLDTTTGGFDLGVPAPLTAPTVVPAEATTDQEEDLIVDRAYVYTYVTIYGEEGPPSPATVESGFDGGAWELTDLADPLTDRDVVITRKRIYRSISSQGDAEFHFVADISVAADLYTDVTGTDTVSTNYTLESEGWAPPPEKLEGLIAHPNGFFVGFVGRDLYFSEPYRPHAWPQDYIVSTMGDIVGLGVYGTTILVATNSHPYVVTGTHPAGMVLTKHDTAEPCVARYGIVSMPFGVYYPGPNGLMLASPRGLENATQQLMTKEEWQNRYQVTEFDAARYQSQYVAFYNKTEGLMFAPDEPFAALVDLSLTGSDQEPDQMQSIFTDEYSGKTFLIEDCAMYEWNPVAGAPLDTDWTSKEFDVPDPVNFGAARIISYAPYTPPTKEEAWAWYIWNTARHAEPLHPMNFACINMVKVIDGLAFDYTVLDANPEVDRDKVIELCETYVQMKQAFHWGPDVWVPIYGEPPVFYPWPYTPYVIFEVIANETVVYSKEVTHTKMFRLPHGYKATRYRFRLRTNIHIQSVKVAETGKELSRV